LEVIFEKEGSLIEVRGNNPLPLNDCDSIWQVYSGKIDIFALRLEGGTYVGSRTHVFRAETGQVLFGMDSEYYGKGIGLLAVGSPGTFVFQFPKPRFRELAADPGNVEAVDRWLHLWVSGLSVGVRKEIPPKLCKEVEPGREILLEEGENVRPSQGTLWVTHLEGASRFMQRMDLPTIGEGAENLIPVSDQAWLHSVGTTRLLARDTQSYLREDPLLSAIDRFHQLILDCILLDIQAFEAEERQRLKLKSANERAVFESALVNLTSTLRHEDVRLSMAEREADPLVAACRLVGQRLGIEIHTPTKEERIGRSLLDAVARTSMVRIRQVALKGEWYHHDHGPLLAYIEEGTKPVGILPLSPRTYVLHDPSARARTAVTSEVASSLAPFAYTFYRPFPDRILKAWDVLRLGLHRCSGDIWMVLTVATLGAILGLLAPIATGIIISTIIPEASRSELGQITLILITCALATSMFDITKGVAMLRIESKMDASMQSGVMDRLLSLPVAFFRNFTAGDLSDRTMGINTIRQIISGVTTMAILSGIFSCFNFLLLFYYDWRLALVASGVAFIGICVTCFISYLIVRYQRKLNTMQGKIAGLVLQFITGISKLRISGTEDRAFAIWAREFTEKKKIAYKSGIVKGVLSTFNSTFPILASMALFAWVVMGSSTLMEVGAFAAFNSAYASFQNALLQMTTAFVAALNIIPLYERAKPILHALPEADITKANPEELTGNIEMSHIRFRYSPDGPLILNDISLEVQPGEFIALVGGSGSGKSTLLRLLLGFEAPESGGIYYDSKDLATLDIREVRRQIGVVLQTGRVMGGDIFKNIIGSSNLTLDDAWEAARMAGFDEDIQQMPMGMHTVISAGGGTLSGGQRQRLLIARAIVRRPRILFFDEATSALDNRTQEIVSRSLEKLQATRIVIAHRLSTIMSAQRIYVIDKGRLVQSGSYEELIDQKGVFAELAKRQIV
jgi:NHLM bacteriocin system ABC transporter ATP-binding protein